MTTTDVEATGGPLAGIRVVEIGSIGPGPFCAMMLADGGADVLRVDRVAGGGTFLPHADPAKEFLHRGRRSIAVDLKHPDGAEVVLRLVDQADALVEGFRPGVAERLGIGPDVCLKRNPRLVYGRMTGFGQDGPLARAAGHDLNYVAQAGVLGMIGRRGQPPTPPLNLVGDFGGGGLLLAFGVLAALLERERSGAGQVIDAAMVEGTALLATAVFNFVATDEWSAERGTNIVDGAAPFYDSYETADGRWLSVAAIEPHFYARLLELLGLDGDDLPDQFDKTRWPETKELVAAAIRTRTRDEWCAAAANVDVCVAPVLAASEVEDDPHLRARGVFVRHGGLLQPAPAPRFSRTPGALSRTPPLPGEHTTEALRGWGFGQEEIEALGSHGVVDQGGNR